MTCAIRKEGERFVLVANSGGARRLLYMMR